MSLFCKTCNDRRLPKWFETENVTLWVCNTCGNLVDGKNQIIRKI